jgi:hypothetical protein
VAKLHDTEKGTEWLKNDDEFHMAHAQDHLDESVYYGADAVSDDDKPYLNKAACWLLFAIATRELV